MYQNHTRAFAALSNQLLQAMLFLKEFTDTGIGKVRTHCAPIFPRLQRDLPLAVTQVGSDLKNVSDTEQADSQRCVRPSCLALASTAETEHVGIDSSILTVLLAVFMCMRQPVPLSGALCSLPTLLRLSARPARTLGPTPRPPLRAPVSVSLLPYNRKDLFRWHAGCGGTEGERDLQNGPLFPSLPTYLPTTLRPSLSLPQPSPDATFARGALGGRILGLITAMISGARSNLAMLHGQSIGAARGEVKRSEAKQSEAKQSKAKQSKAARGKGGRERKAGVERGGLGSRRRTLAVCNGGFALRAGATAPAHGREGGPGRLGLRREGQEEASHQASAAGPLCKALLRLFCTHIRRARTRAHRPMSPPWPT